MNFEFLNGRNLKSDLIRIKDTLAKMFDVVFVYKSVVKNISLDAYLTAISDKDLALKAGIKPLKHKSIINKLKICNERANLDLTYYLENGRSGRVTSMSQLITVLNVFSKIKIIVNNNSREDLAFIVQQLIYIGYPVDKLEIMLNNEQNKFGSYSKFINDINELLERCHNAIMQCDKLLNKVFSDKEVFDDTEIFNHLSRTLDYCIEIRRSLEEEIHLITAINVEIEVAASKKTGKSVIVNSMIGEQLAPTSLTQATPNTCIYKKGPDSNYYLQSVKFDEGSGELIPTGEKIVFKDKDSIFKKINEEFKNAEQNTASNFAIDDMEISYPDNRGFFQSCIIYDTPGPNAAGTSHSRSAEDALKRCKVALFALDYTKYLTNDEFNYLNMVKTHFDKNNKFHSLVFALNKIDMRYTDGGDAKSVIRDTEFIRNRVISIDSKFKECIIFPTSALIYFNTLVAEKAKIPELLESKCLEREFQPIAMEHGDDVEELVSLMNYTNNLSMLSGAKEITLETLKQDSGMPALLSYVSYIAKSKARGEIVNSITCNIDAQRNKVKAILDHIGNIEKLINEDSGTIVKITSIINEYRKKTEGINNKEFTERDLYGINESRFYSYINRMYGKDLNYISIFEIIKRDLREDVSTNDIIDKVYNKLSRVLYKKLENISILESGSDINYIISSKDLEKCISEELIRVFNNVEVEADKSAISVKDFTLYVLRDRMERLQTATQECREKLDKINCPLELPEMGSFDIDLPEPSLDFDFSNVKVNIPLQSLLKNSNIFKKKSFSIKNWWKRITGASDSEFKYQKVDISFTTFVNELRNINFDSAVREFLSREVNLGSHIDENLDKFYKYVEDYIREVENNFDRLTEASSLSINTFQSLVDDRAEYRNNIQALNERRVNIDNIDKITSEFMDEWSLIVNGSQNK